MSPYTVAWVKRLTMYNWFRCTDANGGFYVKQRTDDPTRWSCERHPKRSTCEHIQGVALAQHTVRVEPIGAPALERFAEAS